MEQFKNTLKFTPWILLLLVVLLTGVLSLSANSYQVSLNLNYSKLIKIFNTTTEDLSEN